MLLHILIAILAKSLLNRSCILVKWRLLTTRGSHCSFSVITDEFLLTKRQRGIRINILQAFWMGTMTAHAQFHSPVCSEWHCYALWVVGLWVNWSIQCRVCHTCPSVWGSFWRWSQWRRIWCQHRHLQILHITTGEN